MKKTHEFNFTWPYLNVKAVEKSDGRICESQASFSVYDTIFVLLLAFILWRIINWKNVIR